MLQALESGEVQTLFLAENFAAHVSECTGCGHLDAHLGPECAACGSPTRELNDVSDAIIPVAIRQDLEMFYLRDNEELDQSGNIAALLRFRSAQSRTERLAAVS